MRARRSGSAKTTANRGPWAARASVFVGVLTAVGGAGHIVIMIGSTSAGSVASVRCTLGGGGGLFGVQTRAVSYY